MCGSMVNIQSPTAEIRRGIKKDRNHRAKISCPHLLRRAAIMIMQCTCNMVLRTWACTLLFIVCLTHWHLLLFYVIFLQCFDTVGWVAGRASGLYKMGGWWRWALLSPDGVAPSRMVRVSASVNLPVPDMTYNVFSGMLNPAQSIC